MFSISEHIDSCDNICDGVSVVEDASEDQSAFQGDWKHLTFVGGHLFDKRSLLELLTLHPVAFFFALQDELVSLYTRVFVKNIVQGILLRGLKYI